MVQEWCKSYVVFWGGEGGGFGIGFGIKCNKSCRMFQNE